MTSTSAPHLRILLVDDQPLIRTGFRTILESEPGLEVVGEASNGAEALALAPQLDPDVICMDVQMPVMDGIEATRQLVDSGVGGSILILTTFDRDDFLFQTLQAGASGFLLKTAEAEELIRAVQVLGSGEALLDPQVTRRVLARFSTPGAPAPAQRPDDGSRTSQPTVASQHSASGEATPEATSEAPVTEPPSGMPVPPGGALTGRESEILLLLARGWSNAEIAANLVVGEATVKTHVSNVLMKLGARDRIHAVIWAYENGLVGA